MLFEMQLTESTGRRLSPGKINLNVADLKKKNSISFYFSLAFFTPAVIEFSSSFCQGLM